jgi:hypothetical protein
MEFRESGTSSVGTTTPLPRGFRPRDGENGLRRARDLAASGRSCCPFAVEIPNVRTIVRAVGDYVRSTSPRESRRERDNA